MKRWCGNIAFTNTVEVEQDVWVDQPVTKFYKGNILQEYVKNQDNNVNEDINISNRVSVITDMFLMSHLNSISYVEFYGIKWKVSSIEVSYPRVNLTLGGVYNG